MKMKKFHTKLNFFPEFFFLLWRKKTLQKKTDTNIVDKLLFVSFFLLCGCCSLLVYFSVSGWLVYYEWICVSLSFKCDSLTFNRPFPFPTKKIEQKWKYSFRWSNHHATATLKLESPNETRRNFQFSWISQFGISVPSLYISYSCSYLAFHWMFHLLSLSFFSFIGISKFCNVNFMCVIR